MDDKSQKELKLIVERERENSLSTVKKKSMEIKTEVKALLDALSTI